jgi:hypothetical protein
VRVPIERDDLRFVDAGRVFCERRLSEGTRQRRCERKRSRNSDPFSEQFGVISLSRPGTSGGENPSTSKSELKHL